MTEAQRSVISRLADSPDVMDALRAMVLDEANEALPRLRGAAFNGDNMEALRQEVYIRTVEALPDLIERTAKKHNTSG